MQTTQIIPNKKAKRLGAPNQNDDLKYLAQDFREKSTRRMKHQSSSWLWSCQFNFGFGQYSKSVVDTMGGIETASRVIDDLDIPSNKPVTTLAYTHFHADHTLGAQAFVDQFSIENVISHETTVAEIRFFGIKRDLDQ